MSRLGTNRGVNRRRLRGVVQGTGLIAAASLALVGCTGTGPDEVSPTRILQSVAVSVDPSGAVTVIDGTAVYLDEASGRSASSATSYAVKDVVDDLPVRVTTQYRTADGNGSDLTDLAGYSGRVEIGITVENLTVSPSVVTYDAAGRSRETPALVGTPLSVAASAKLDGIAASSVVFSADEPRATNGVVSSVADGDAVVQWATLLAPPQSEATATFFLIADVEDLSVPEIGIAVQAGLHTNLSFDGVVASAFDTSATSELGMQQRAISLIAEVNDVLNRAGNTITEVRKNLNDTSESLGVRASQQLSESTTSLAAQMEGLGLQLTSLENDMQSTVTGTQSAMHSQLSQIVTSMNGMLGNTSGQPRYTLDGEGCAATVNPGEAGGTLYATFLQLSGLLNGYAEANEGCRDQVADKIDTILGPVESSEETCSEPSMTCALYDAKQTVAHELRQLVIDGETIIDQLDADIVTDAVSAHTDLGTILASLDGYMDGLGTGADDETLWTQIEAAMSSASNQAALLDELHVTASDALAELTGPGVSVQQQHQELADLICDIADEPGVVIDPELLEQLRAHVVDTKCDNITPQDSWLIPATGSLDQRLTQQVTYWQAVADATAPDSSTLAGLQTDLNTLQSKLTELRAAATTDATTVATLIADLQVFSTDALDKHEDLGELIEAIEENQAEVKGTLGDALEQAADDVTDNIAGKTDAQIEAVSEQVGEGRQALVDAYNTTIAGLSSTSEAVLADGKTQIDGQKATLEVTQAEASASLDERTVTALERINSSTSASTRNVEAASAMLADSLNKVILDLGDPKVQGSGILGAMSASAAKSDTADYQLALASQRAAGYANVRAEDIAGIMLRQAQFQAALEAAATLPAFHLNVPNGATSQTIYTVHLGGGEQ